MIHSFRPLAGFCATVLLTATIPLFSVSAALAGEVSANVRTISATDDGPSVVAYLPTSGGSTTVGVYEQLSAVTLLKGSMTLVVGDADTEADGIPAGPDWVIVVEQNWEPVDAEGNPIEEPVFRVSDTEMALSLIRGAIGDSFGDAMPPLSITSLRSAASIGGEGTIIMQLPIREVPKSRRNRWARNLTLDLLVHLEMLDERPALTSLVPEHELGYALYDSEGVGGAGPARMERIVNRMPNRTAVMRVCPEDIHDGALDAFHGVIFPGGSGRGIANALQEHGQDIVRQYISGGGGYMGICAGAYLATCRIDGYLEMVGLYHGQPWRKGGGMLDVELTLEGQRIFGEEFTTFSTRYNNGPIFIHEDGLTPEGDFEDVTVLANFRSAVKNPDGELSEEMIDTPAIVSSTYGNGNVILVSPHPETHEPLYPLMQRGLLWMTKRETGLGR